MMRLFLLLNAVLFFTHCSYSQTKDNPLSAGITAGLTEYNGDLGQGLFDFTNAKPFGGLHAALYINPHVDLGTTLAFGKWGFEEKNNIGFETSQLQLNLGAKIKLLNNDSHKFYPYLFGGIGVAKYTGYRLRDSKENKIKFDDGDKGIDVYAPVGIGFQYQLTDKWNVFLQETYCYTDHDNRDATERNNNDVFFTHQLGLTYNFGQIKDEDKDGVADRKDKCPGTPSGVKVDENGCPLDKDGDGIADYIDACPDVKGVAAAKGCPDKDGDSITDAEDSCPDEPGTVALKGCPDKDNDGITDNEDECPELAGTKETKGCPDKDGDLVTDSEDKCPEVKGTVAMNGCPDTDEDGVADADDKCPEVKGVKENQGCPLVDNDFVRSLPVVYFQTGSAVISNSFARKLTAVARVMKANADYKLVVEGHADNKGEEDFNMTLSQKRADAVLNYLVKKGIDQSRLNTQAFGETKPADTNDTEKGRSKNRRVQFSTQ